MVDNSGLKIGIWATNGYPSIQSRDLMYSWLHGAAVTCFHDYLGPNGVFWYKANNPNAKVIIRFQHPKNWRENWQESAYNFGREIAGKWSEIMPLDPYVYFCNEMNLHYENGDGNQNNQQAYQTPAFYSELSKWVNMTAKVIKDFAPEMRLVFPPLAAGHDEDGFPYTVPIGAISWAGFDYFQEGIKKWFDNTICAHFYWGGSWGETIDWLYGEKSIWYAMRWKRYFELFEKRYNQNIKMIIDECGNFAADSPTFTDQLLYYVDECAKEPRIIALTPFLWNDPTNSAGNILNSWQRMGHDRLREHCRRLGEYNRSVVSPPVTPPEPEPPIPPVEPPEDCQRDRERLNEAVKLLGRLREMG